MLTVRELDKIRRYLRKGETIYHGAFCGWYVSTPDRKGKQKYITYTAIEALLEEGFIRRIDDMTSAQGVEYAISDSKVTVGVEDVNPRVAESVRVLLSYVRKDLIENPCDHSVGICGCGA